MKDREDPAATIDAPPGGTGAADSGPRSVAGELVPGQVFAGRYDVEALIGRGGMGSVWRVRDRMVGETVALKTLSLPPDNAERALERFRREVRLARRITSPHVARTHDLGSAGVHYLTMEYVEGPSLSRVIEDERAMQPERAARIAAQIADGLAAAHAAGVVHRDLKPDNVLVEAKTSRVVVTDFGIARALHDTDAANRTGGIVGTPLYMSPEQVGGGKVDERTDIYALGLVLFEMLTGEVAFDGDTPIAAAVKRLHQPPRDPRVLRRVPDELADLVLRCLARDPAQRFPDAGALARALHGYAGKGSIVGGEIALAHTSFLPSTTSTPSQRSPVAPLLKHDRGLAVIPFAYRGPSDGEWIADGIGDELIDVLSRTRGLRVLGRGAVESYGREGQKGSRDPREIGRALGVDFVVDGTVQSAGSKLRVTVRLTEAAGGVQIWTDRFESELEDLLAVQERVAQRIAEALRVSLHGLGGGGASSVALAPDVLELYMRARARVRAPNLNEPVEIVRMLDRVIEAAPEFGAAYAAHAIACVRAWFMPGNGNTGRDWAGDAARSVERALEHAPDLAETHYARAQLASNRGEFREAVAAVRTALEIAPTLPEAHHFLGSLQIEAGRAKEGLQRLDLALALEPKLTFAMLEKARWHGLYGDLAVFEQIASAWGEDPSKEAFLAQQLIRAGAFRGDRTMMMRGSEMIGRTSHPAASYLQLYARVMAGEVEATKSVGMLTAVLNGPISDRFRTLVHQLCAEAFGAVGDAENALHHFRAGAERVLVDLEWVDRCPLLAPIRGTAEFAELRMVVRTRCEAIWAF